MPNKCNDFYQRLIEQKVCLSEFHSQNLHSFNVQVKVIHDNNHQHHNSTTLNSLDFKKEVKLRYTLDNWRTFTECPTLTCLNQLTPLTLPCQNDQCIETYESEVILTLTPYESKYNQLEFAVVYRGDHFEYWDNNHSQNYKCFASSF
ncbi:unnamed protein product [Schistosoma turkestanicum]|nr:unnamed protein product [Schistosoma turkestanicum]